MNIPSDLRPCLIVREALLPEPVKITATTPIGLSMKLTNINLVERLDSILNHDQMPQEIVDGLGALGGAPESEFEALVERVEGRFEKGRHYPVVLQFIRDDSMLRDEELEHLFRFIYNSLVSNFKGELAEALARPSLAEFAAILRVECGMSALETIPGHEVRARQGGRRGGLYKWADAVFVRRDGSNVLIAAIAEVKSMRRSVEDVRAQVERHVARLKRGLLLGEVEFGPDRIAVQIGKKTIPVSRLRSADAKRIPWILVEPWVAATSGTPIRHPELPNVWIAELPYSADVLMEAAYRFAAWYFGRIGPKVFLAPGDEPVGPDDLRCPAPHAEMSLEENGTNRFIESLAGAARRDSFRGPVTAARGGRQSPAEVLIRLYNTFGFGYEQADSSDIMFTEFTPDEQSQARWDRWNLSMESYRAGRLVEAMAQHPDPEGQTHLTWRHREWLMLARLRARTGNTEGARAALRAREALEPSRNLAIPLETACVDVLVELADGGARTVDDRFQQALAGLGDLQTLVRSHEENGWAFPSELDQFSAQAGVIDLAVAAVTRGNASQAMELLSALRRPSGWEKTLFENDAVLSTLFSTPGSIEKLWAEISSRDDGLQRF